MLEVTPQITPEGNVIMNVEVSRTASVRSMPACRRSTRSRSRPRCSSRTAGRWSSAASSSSLESTDVTKVPFLGDIPYLGALFKTTTSRMDRTELLIFLTPKVV